MVESQIIVDKLKTEGIDEGLAKGIAFETEEALNEWVGVAKTFATKPKGIEEYTKEEIEAILKEPQPKAKGLQGYFDSMKAKSKAATASGTSEKSVMETLAETITSLKAELESIKSGFDESKKMTAKQLFEAEIGKHTNGLSEYEVKMVKATLSETASTLEIKNAFDTYRSEMSKKGLSGYTPKDANGQTKQLDGSYKDAIKKMVEKQTKK